MLVPTPALLVVAVPVATLFVLLAFEGTAVAGVEVVPGIATEEAVSFLLVVDDSSEVLTETGKEVVAAGIVVEGLLV